MPIVIYASNFSADFLPSDDEIIEKVAEHGKGYTISSNTLCRLTMQECVDYLEKEREHWEWAGHCILNDNSVVVITTISEIPILYFLKQVAKGRIKPDDLIIYECDTSTPVRKRVDETGEFIDRWTNFFRTREKLLFY